MIPKREDERMKLSAMCSMAMVGVAAISTNGFAAPVASYNFGPDTTTTSYAASFEASGVEADDITRGSGISGTTSNGSAVSGISTGQGNPVPALFIRAVGTASSEAAAFAGDDFISFTISAPSQADYLDLESITLEYVQQSRADSWEGTIGLRSSLDGYTTTLASTTRSTGPNVSTPSWTGSSRTLSLGEAFPLVAESVTFRLYFWSTDQTVQAPTNTFDLDSIFRVDNIAVNGVVTVPEPATLSLLALAALPMLRRRRA
jgi:hypothetical protein